MCRICYTPSPYGGMMPLLGSALGYKDKYWQPGEILTISVLGAGDSVISFIMRAAQIWMQHANITFIYTDDWDSATCRIQLDPRLGSWSYIGTDNLMISKGAPTMNLGWIDDDIKYDDLSTVLHELGHFLGLGHEHQNPNEPIKWIVPNVMKDQTAPPNNWSRDQVYSNIINIPTIDEVDATTLDRDSIMMYFFPDHWVQSGVGTKQNKQLSRLDKEFISLIYPKQKEADTCDEQVRSFIHELIYNDRKVNRLDNKQIRSVLSRLDIPYSSSDRRRTLKTKLKEVIS